MATRDRELGRVRGAFGLAVGAFTAAAGLFLRVRGLDGTHLPLGTPGVLLCFALALAAVLAAWVARPTRAALFILGPASLAAGAALALPLWALFAEAQRGTLLTVALEAAGGFALTTALIRYGETELRRALAPVGSERVARGGKVELARPRADRKKKVPVESLVPGDEVEVGLGANVPADGTIIAGRGFVDESNLVGPTLPSPKKPGDGILAGSEPTIPDLVVRVEVPPEESFIHRRDRRVARVAQALACTAFRRWEPLFIASILLAAAGAGFQGFRLGHASLTTVVAVLASVALASSAGPPYLARLSGRLALLHAARASGLFVARAKDLLAIPRVRRWQIDSELLSAPGDVEVVVLAHASPPDLLRIAAALVAVGPSPERTSIEATLQRKKLEIAPASAVHRQGPLHVGVIEGVRWSMGPAAALAESGPALDPAFEGRIQFLGERQRITWLLAREYEVVGAIGIDLEADLDAKRTARLLAATLMPGPSEATRKAVAAQAELSSEGPAITARDGTILSECTPAPGVGLCLRVLPVRPPIPLGPEPTLRILQPSLGQIGGFLGATRRFMRTVHGRVLVLALAPGLLAALVAVPSPLFGTALACLGLLSSGRADALSQPQASSRSRSAR